MGNLKTKRCEPCDGGIAPLNPDEITQLLLQVSDWSLATNGEQITKRFKFKGFYKTMSFVNAVAWIVNQQGHHPTLEIGYDYCYVHFTTHNIGGLSINDFICAAKIDALVFEN